MTAASENALKKHLPASTRTTVKPVGQWPAHRRERVGGGGGGGCYVLSCPSATRDCRNRSNHNCNTELRSRGSSGSIVSDYGPDDRGSIPGRGERIFPLTFVSRPALRPTQPPIQRVPAVKCGRDVALTTHSHLVPRSWMSRSYISYPHNV
jgi:hypothetical protein